MHAQAGGHAFENVEGLVDLQQLVCAAGTPPLLLGFAVIYVPFVLAGSLNSRIDSVYLFGWFRRPAAIAALPSAGRVATRKRRNRGRTQLPLDDDLQVYIPMKREESLITLARR